MSLATSRSSRSNLLLAALLCLPTLSPGSGQAQSPQSIDFSQVTRPVVFVTDSALIDYLLFELIIEPAEWPSRMQVIDITQNGYGPDDVVVIYPSAEAFLIPEFLPDSVQQVMSSWEPEIEFRLDAGNLPSQALAAMLEHPSDTTMRAENAIVFDVVQAVERNYHDLPVGILFERDSLGFTFQLWDYNRQAMRYSPRPEVATDSTVSSVLSMLRDVGYLPGESDAGLAVGLDRTMVSVASVEQALTGISGFSNEFQRQLAARTVLLGSYDFDRSGAIDTARETDAVPCRTWMSLNGTFPAFLTRFGFAESGAEFLGSIVFSISASVREPVARRFAACLEGAIPPPTRPEDVVSVVNAAQLPQPVGDYLAMEAAAAIVAAAAPDEPGSANWAASVRNVLLEYFDSDISGSLDRAVEVNTVPCDVWRAVRSTHEDLVIDLALDGEGRYTGDRIGVASLHRDRVRSRIVECLVSREERVTHQVRAADTSTRSPSGEGYSVANALTSLGAFPMEERQLATRTLILSIYDADRSGDINTATELDAIQCDVWTSLETVFPGFVEEYGFGEPIGPAGRGYRGDIVFSISERLRGPTGARAAACLAGEPPPATDSAGIEDSRVTVSLSRPLQQFIATAASARIARRVARLEAGSAAWAAAVRDELIAEYDLDRSDWIDAARETEAIPCIVWDTILATSGGTMDHLSFGQGDRYLGDRIGVDRSQREPTARALTTCSD